MHVSIVRLSCFQSSFKLSRMYTPLQKKHSHDLVLEFLWPQFETNEPMGVISCSMAKLLETIPADMGSLELLEHVLCLFWRGSVHHRWLSRIPAIVGSQEVVGHTHKLALLIGQCFLQCRLGRPLIIINDPTCTTICYRTCTYLLFWGAPKSPQCAVNPRFTAHSN